MERCHNFFFFFFYILVKMSTWPTDIEILQKTLFKILNMQNIITSANPITHYFTISTTRHQPLKITLFTPLTRKIKTLLLFLQIFYITNPFLLIKQFIFNLPNAESINFRING